MKKIKLLKMSIIAIMALGMFFTSCKKELTCYCQTSTVSGNFSKDLREVLDEVMKKKKGNCGDVASKLRNKGYANVSCTEQ